MTPVPDDFNHEIEGHAHQALTEHQQARATTEQRMDVVGKPIALTQAGVTDFGDDVLCGLYLLIQDDLNKARDRLGLVEWEIRRRLTEKNATVIGSGKNKLILRPGAVRNSYLPEKLELLKEPLGIDAWNEVMRPQVVLTPDRRALNEWAKRGGEIAAIIAEAVIEQRAPGKLEKVKP
mgnify:CR=1 FL=1